MLSIVTTMYNSASHLEEFYQRASETAHGLGEEFELILVSDGSPDGSLALALKLREKDSKLRVVELSRNFGHHKAMMCGLKYASGDHVFLIDSDLEEPPELLLDFWRAYQASETDVVYGIQSQRKGNWFERLSGALSFKLFNVLSDVPLPTNVSTVRLMTRRYVDALLEHKEREVCIAGLWQITGFHQTPFLFKKGAKGSSSYSFGAKVALFVNFLTSFSNRPLVAIFYLGTVISAIAGVAATYWIFKVLFLGGFLAGWASLIVSIWLLGGLTIFSIGVVGIYLSKVFIEVKYRPYSIVRSTHGFEDS